MRLWNISSKSIHISSSWEWRLKLVFSLSNLRGRCYTPPKAAFIIPQPPPKSCCQFFLSYCCSWIFYVFIWVSFCISELFISILKVGEVMEFSNNSYPLDLYSKDSDKKDFHIFGTNLRFRKLNLRCLTVRIDEKWLGKLRWIRPNMYRNIYVHFYCVTYSKMTYLSQLQEIGLTFSHMHNSSVVRKWVKCIVQM